MPLELNAGPYKLQVAPDIGGSVIKYTYQDKDILKPAPEQDEHTLSPLECSGFPMLPFCGRIAFGRFKLGGKSQKLLKNFLPEPHAIHGYSWQSAWAIQRCDETLIELTYFGNTDAWPWEYKATQLFELTRNGLSLTLTLENLDDREMPFGLGWHPYLVKEDAVLQASTKMVWLIKENCLPAPPTLVSAHIDLSDGKPVSDLRIDHAYDVETPEQVIERDGLRIKMVSDPVFRKLVVYVPDDEDYYCVEPCTQAPDAVNSKLPNEQTGLRVLTPGESYSATIKLFVDD